MDKMTIFESARGKVKNCRICKDCNGIACRGEIPGLGGKDSGSSFIRNREMLKKVKLNMNVLTMSSPISTESHIFDEKLSMPVFVAPIANVRVNYGCDLSDYEYNKMVIEACKEMEILSFTGDGVDSEEYFNKPLLAVDENDGHGIITMKPWVKKGIDERIELLKEKKYKLIAMDVDSAGLPLLKDSEVLVETKDAHSLEYVKNKTGKKLIVKGVMSVQGALVALEAKADAIIVSNHGGRVLDDTLSTIEVLSNISSAVKGRMTILIDGGIRSGNDIFKCLALGADGVLIGRPCALATIGSGKKGLEDLLSIYKKELIQAMKMTGCHKITDISRECVTVIK